MTKATDGDENPVDWAPDRIERCTTERLQLLVAQLRRELEDHDPIHEAPNGSSVVLAEVDVDGYTYVLSRLPRPRAQKLSPRERQIALLVKEGLTNKAIAFRLRLSRSTVATHLRRIFNKLNIDSRVTLAQKNLGRGSQQTRG